MPEFEGEGTNVLCKLFSVCSRSMNSSQCLSLPIINSLSSTICKADVLEGPLVSNVFLSINAIFFFRYESTDTCWIFYFGSSSCTCEITTVKILVLLSSDETNCQLHKAKINRVPGSVQVIVAI